MKARLAPALASSLAAALAALAVGCGPAPSRHKLVVDVNLTAQDAGVGIPTQNGSTAWYEPAALADKPCYWMVTNVGESFANGVPLEFGAVALSASLAAHLETSERYRDGPLELSLYVSLTGGVGQPQHGDLAAFDNGPTPTGEPAPTGQSVRVHVAGGDATVRLGNASFIPY
jgi:hypothetical protein